jgi:hypothetical protein
MPQGPNYGLQGGSQWVISDEGTLTIGAGGTINVESGGVINVASGGSIVNGGGQSASSLSVTTLTVTNPVTLGGTTAKWGFGTVSLTSGVGTIGLPGFTRVLSANANNILGEASGNGSATSVHVDLSLSGAGSIIFRAVAGTLGYAANQIISWQAWGT